MYQAPRPLSISKHRNISDHGIVRTRIHTVSYAEEMDGEELFGANTLLGLLVDYGHSRQTLENGPS